MALQSVLSEIQLITLGPIQLVLGGLCAGLIILGLPMLRTFRRQRAKQKFLKEDLSVYKLLLDASTEPMCWWQDQNKPIYCTQGGIELLGLDSNQPIFIQDVINQFSNEHAYVLDSHLANLKQNFEAFKIVARLVNEQTIIQVSGARFCDRTQVYTVLTFKDITRVHEKIQRLEQKLENSEIEVRRLNHVLNMIPVAVWSRDQQQRIRYCNQVYAGIIDATPDLVVSENREIIDKQRTASPYHLALKAENTNTPQTRRSHIIVDGHRRLIEVTEIPKQESMDSVGYALDLTDLEESVTELAKHIAAHQEVLHHLSTPIAVYSADTRLEFFNHAYLKLFQFEEKWLYQKPTCGEVLQDLRERRKLPEYSDFIDYRRGQLQLFNTLINPVHELIHQPDGQILRMMIVPHPLGGLLFMFDDVTDKIALERRYNTLIAVQKETIDNLYEGIVVLGSDSRLRLSNPAAVRIWQASGLELVPGRHAGDILYEIRHVFKGYKDWDLFRQRLLSFFNERKPATDQIELYDNSLIQYSYVPLPDGSHLISFVDISDRWRFEQALRERNEALEQADRIKSDFISHISYELRSPLNTIIGFSEILQNQYFGPLNERQNDYCRGIFDSSQRLLSLINDIIDFASIEAGQLNSRIEQVDLESFLSSLVALVYNRSNDQGLEIFYKNNVDIKYFYADERRLKQAIFNLLMNAIKFTPSGGRIELAASIIETDTGNDLCLEVIDTGVGMDEIELENLTHIFDVTNKSLKPNGLNLRGNVPGIGLSLVKSFIGLHGGSVTIESRKGRGTTVRCVIPLVLERPQNSPLVNFDKSELAI